VTVRAVFFDWGHTLFDTAGSIDFIVDWTFRNGGVTDEPASTPDEVGRLWNDARLASRSAAELAKGRDKSAALHRECWLALWTDLDQRWPGVAAALYEHETSAAGWSPYVDTAEVLRAVAERGIQSIVVSDVPFDLRPIFAHYELGSLVSAYVLSGEHGTIKPELELFRIAMATAGVRADEVLMVGDNHVNDGAAIEVGIRTLLLPPVPSGSPRGLWAVLDLVDG
jgi:HAD superfamily hydrolase (TIGR01509 family)